MNTNSFKHRVAGNIARDNAKNLRIEEYNALFGVSEAEESPVPGPTDYFAARLAQKLQKKLEANAKKTEKARQARENKRKVDQSGWMFSSLHSHEDHDLDSDY